MNQAAVIADAASAADAEGQALLEEVGCRVNGVLLALADELDAEAAWRRDEAGWARREGRAADAIALDVERKAFEKAADLLRGRMRPPMPALRRADRGVRP
ncbi:MAG TPA: hypothetical protein VMS17_31550 [Gemmataceae bacterium]|nr:hypothetical protein [Gemmataceae bacterium]